MIRRLLGSIRYFANLPERRADALRQKAALETFETILAAGRQPGESIGPVRQQLDQLSRQTDLIAQRQLDFQRETELLLAQLGLPSYDSLQISEAAAKIKPRRGVFSHSSLCREDSFRTPEFAYWARQIGSRVFYHRKLWEFVYILQALWERDAIQAGARGLGFGVGGEPLTAWFAAQDCRITATDMAAEAAAQAGWTRTQEHAAGKAALARPALCPSDRFETNVAFRACDMNAVSDDLQGYDFCWSACALEHLGSIEQGLTFIQRSLDTLRPGGWAVHTTEFNLYSNTDTVDDAHTVLFRRRDMQELWRRLTEAGHEVAPLDLDPGSGPVDRYIDVAPYRDEPHLKLALEGYATTSIGVIIRKAPSPA